MKNELIAKASISIHAPVHKVWNALVKPEMIKQYMFGTDVISDWKEGSPITWKGVWDGKPYEDKGIILKMDVERTLQYSHYSPLEGQPDKPGNYHTVTYLLSGKGDNTIVSITQDNNVNVKAKEHSRKNWEMMLASLKKILEAG